MSRDGRQTISKPWYEQDEGAARGVALERRFALCKFQMAETLIGRRASSTFVASLGRRGSNFFAANFTVELQIVNWQKHRNVWFYWWDKPVAKVLLIFLRMR